MAATEKIEMRTCKTCGETKPLEAGFYKITARNGKTFYRHICKICRSGAWRKPTAKRKAASCAKPESSTGEMRTCKTCGETKPLEAGFNVIHRNGVKTYYYSSCKTCRNKEVKRKRLEKCAEKRAAEEAAAVWQEYGAMSGAMLHEHIRASHAACPILGIGLWTQSA